jgi:thiamine-monophosphate kinase
MIELAQQSGVAIAGGNISRSPLVSITITVIGESINHNILKRSAGRPGDAIAVTGYLGSAAAGLEILTTKLKFKAPAVRYLKNAFLHPLPRIKEGQCLVKHGVAAAIDISDGLLADLRHICEASHVSARVITDLLPVHDAVKANFKEKALALVLGGGEDYELLFTGSAGTIKEIKDELDCPVTIIGEITGGEPGKISLVDAAGNPVKIGQTGWEHF